MAMRRQINWLKAWNAAKAGKTVTLIVKQASNANGETFYLYLDDNSIGPLADFQPSNAAPADYSVNITVSLLHLYPAAPPKHIPLSWRGEGGGTITVGSVKVVES